MNKKQKIQQPEQHEQRRSKPSLLGISLAWEFSLRMSSVIKQTLTSQPFQVQRGRGWEPFFPHATLSAARVGRESGGGASPLAFHLGKRLAPPLNGSPFMKLREGQPQPWSCLTNNITFPFHGSFEVLGACDFSNNSKKVVLYL